MNKQISLFTTALVFVLLTLMKPQVLQAQTTQIGTFLFETNYSENSGRLVIAVHNTSSHRDDTMRCLSLPASLRGKVRITNSPRSGWYFPDSVSACAVFSNQFIHEGEFVFFVEEQGLNDNSLTVSYLSRSDKKYTGTLLLDGVVQAKTAPVANAGQDIVVRDRNSEGGFQIKLDASGSFDDGNIVTYEWYDGNNLVATGKSPTLYLANESSITLELVVEDDEGATDSDFIDIVTSSFVEMFNGVEPDARAQLGLNNIGVYEPLGNYVFLCVQMRANDALTDQEDGLIDHNLTLQLIGYRPLRFSVVETSIFNPYGQLNPNGEQPDCSGHYDHASGILEDFVQVGSLTGSIRFSWTDVENTELTVTDFSWIRYQW